MAGRRATLSFALLQIVLGLVLVAGLWFAWPAWRLGVITDQLHKHYPGVPFFTTADLGTWLDDPVRSKPAILDVRSAAEYQVSHLIEATSVDPAEELPAAKLPEDHRRVIIIYCGAGEQAAAYATRLQEAGYTRVFVLEGGIIRWANEGRALTDGKALVTRVRPENQRDEALLSRLHRDSKTTTP